MPDICCLDKCSNQNDGNVSCHKWPSTHRVSEKWIEFTREANNDSEWMPCGSSRICSVHFEPDCFRNYLQFTMGLAKKLVVKPEAVPTRLPSSTLSIQSEPPVYENEITLAPNPMQVGISLFSIFIAFTVLYGSKVRMELDCILL